MNYNKLHINIQLFAIEAGGEAGAGNGAANATPTEPKTEPTIEFDPSKFKGNKTFDDYIASIADKSARTAATNAEKAAQKQREADKAEWERQSKLTAEEREKEAIRKADEERKTLAEENARLKGEKIAAKYLKSIGLSDSEEMVAMVVSGDENEMKLKADNLLKVVDSLAEAKKANALAGSVKAPKAGEPPTTVDPFVSGLLGKKV